MEFSTCKKEYPRPAPPRAPLQAYGAQQGVYVRKPVKGADFLEQILAAAAGGGGLVNSGSDSGLAYSSLFDPQPQPPASVAGVEPECSVDQLGAGRPATAAAPRGVPAARRWHEPSLVLRGAEAPDLAHRRALGASGLFLPRQTM